MDISRYKIPAAPDNLSGMDAVYACFPTSVNTRKHAWQTLNPVDIVSDQPMSHLRAGGVLHICPFLQGSQNKGM